MTDSEEAVCGAVLVRRACPEILAVVVEATNLPAGIGHRSRPFKRCWHQLK